MSVRCYVEWVNNVPPTRMAKLTAAGTVDGWYILLGPLSGETEAAASANRTWLSTEPPAPFFPAPLRRYWAWWVCGSDQTADLAGLRLLAGLGYPIDGFVLDIEKPLEGQDLTTLISGVAALGKPIVASIGGMKPPDCNLDWRTLDKFNVTCEIQAYFDSGEGDTPPVAVAETYQPTRLHMDWWYRSRIGTSYGWGQVRGDQTPDPKAPRYLRGGKAYVACGESSDGWNYSPFLGRGIYGSSPPVPPSVGTLLGHARYAKIRVALDVTRTAQHTPAEWTAIAASARVPGAAKRGSTVYLAEVASDETLEAINRGAS